MVRSTITQIFVLFLRVQLFWLYSKFCFVFKSAILMALLATNYIHVCKETLWLFANIVNCESVIVQVIFHFSCGTAAAEC